MTDQQPFHLDKHRIRNAFAKAATQYEQRAVLQKEVGMRLIERLDHFKGLSVRTIYDIGSGPGSCSFPLLKKFTKARVVAIDIAHDMLAEVRRRSAWWRKPQPVCADLEQLPFANDSADLIFSNLAIQWSTDLDRALVEFYRVLKPNGLLLFTSFGPDTLQELRNSWAQQDQHTHVNTFLDMHDVGDALQRNHYLDPVMDRENFTLTYASVKQLMQDLKVIGAHNATTGRCRGLTGKHRLQAMQEHYESYRSQGVLPATYEVIYGHAIKPAEPPQLSTNASVSIPLSMLTNGKSR